MWVGGIAFAVSMIALYGWLNRLSGSIGQLPAS
jgi:hypothetical protein